MHISVINAVVRITRHSLNAPHSRAHPGVFLRLLNARGWGAGIHAHAQPMEVWHESEYVFLTPTNKHRLAAFDP